MRDTYEKKFRSPEVLAEMLVLRYRPQEPLSLKAIGAKFAVDHTSVLYQCRKFESVLTALPAIDFASVLGVVEAQKTIPNPRFAKRNAPVYNPYTDFDGTRINPGKNYHEYVAIERERKSILARKQAELHQRRQEAKA